MNGQAQNFSVADLDSLLEGKPPVVTETPAAETTPATEPPATDIPPADVPPADGGDPSLVDPPKDDAAVKAEEARSNAAFAKQRKELAEYERTIKSLATALNIDEKDPAKILASLSDLAYKKQSQTQNVDPEILKELDMLRTTRAEQTIQSKFLALQSEQSLSNEELVAFATMIDAQGINVMADPNIDLDYLYFKLNSTSVMEKRIQAAVEEAVRKVTKAGAQSSTPSKQIGKSSEEPTPINTMAGLNDLLDKK